MSSVRVDIVSDVVCPWCIVGLRQLQLAADNQACDLQIHWHPFELNPQMPEIGQNLQEHMCEKYGTTVEQSTESRERLTTLGDQLGFAFQFDENSRIVNTFKAHQLIHWAASQSRELGHSLKLALFSAYFTQQLDISDTDVLLGIVSTLKMDLEAAQRVLDDGTHQAVIRNEQKIWTDRGITGVPAMVFNQKYLVSGAQGTENYTEILNKVVLES